MMSEFDPFTPDPEAVKAWVEKHLMPKQKPALVWRGRHPDVAKGADGKMFTAIEENIQAEHHDKPRTVPSQNNIPWNRRTWHDASPPPQVQGLVDSTPIELVMTDASVWLCSLEELRVGGGWSGVRQWRILLPHEEPLKPGMKGRVEAFHLLNNLRAGDMIRRDGWSKHVRVDSIDRRLRLIALEKSPGCMQVYSWNAFAELTEAP